MRRASHGTVAGGRPPERVRPGAVTLSEDSHIHSFYNEAMRIGSNIPIALALALAIAAANIGCTQRTIEVTSEPSGALVHLNDRQVGRTPVTVPFLHYGKYDVRLERDGHHPLWTTARAWPPPWDLPGLDLLFEAIPGTHVRLAWHFELEEAPPAAEVDDAELLDRAEQLRTRLRDEDD